MLIEIVIGVPIPLHRTTVRLAWFSWEFSLSAHRFAKYLRDDVQTVLMASNRSTAPDRRQAAIQNEFWSLSCKILDDQDMNRGPVLFYSDHCLDRSRQPATSMV